jgi:FkbH-like protein
MNAFVNDGRMRYADALRRAQHPRGSRPFRVLLAHGATAVHLETFLTAHLLDRLPGHAVHVTPGLYDDVPGTLRRDDIDEFDACAIALEWADFDPRLGFRRLGGWQPQLLDDIVQTAAARADLLHHAISAIPAHVRVALVLPTLPIAPAFLTPGWSAGADEWRLRADVATFATACAEQTNVHIGGPQFLDEGSPAGARFDFAATLHSGIAYTREHAERLADQLARLLAPPAPKKGLITDLDGTLWQGILGEVGADGVQWDLGSGALLHGLYQQLLGALADGGVLIGVATRNDESLVRKAFARRDIVLPLDRVFPLEVHWNAKSASVGRILNAWNVAADTLVVVDDSRMELAEIEAAHPGIAPLLFPETVRDGATFLRKVRDLFGRERLGNDDALRRESLRAGAQFQAGEPGDPANSEMLLRSAGAIIGFDFTAPSTQARPLELVNKTNQFNLNGIRYTDGEWHRALAAPDSFAVAVSYEDKFGPLGTIAVLKGVVRGDAVHVDTWVMSCRAFARRIEHQCLQMLVATFGADRLHFAFAPTARNEPLQRFFASVLGDRPTGAFAIDARRLNLPLLYHAVTVAGRPREARGVRRDVPYDFLTPEPSSQ